MIVSRWIQNLLFGTAYLTSLLVGSGHAQDLRIVRTVGPYSHGVAVENLEMVQPGSLALSMALSRGTGILDAIDPPSGRRISVIDTHLNLDISSAWQYNDSVRFQIAASGSHVSGQAFGGFDGGGYEFGDIDLGVRWRLLNQKDLGLQLGIYADVVFPTGDSTQLAGVGSTNLHVGTMLSQRFDDLTFQGMLGYRHRTKPAKFADAAFRNVIDYRAGLYIPLDWPNWVIFTEIAGLLNATSSDMDGTEPAEVFGGLSFGEFTNVALAFSTGLNDQGGASARRFSLRVSHHFDAQERAMAPNIVPVTANIALFQTERGRTSKEPIQSASAASTQPPHPGKVSPEQSTVKAMDTGSKQLETPKPALADAKKASKAIPKANDLLTRLTPAGKALKPVRAIQSPSTLATAVDAVERKPSKKRVRVAALTPNLSISTASSRDNKTTLSPPKTMTSPKGLRSKKAAKTMAVQTQSNLQDTHKAAASKAVRKDEKSPKHPPKSLATTKTPVKSTRVTSKVSSSASITEAQKITDTAAYSMRRPGPKVLPMVTPRQPMTLVYRAGQIVPSASALKQLINEVKAHISSEPSTRQILVEAYAAPGERAYTPHTHTAQRDAYLLANARAKDVLTKLKRVFSQLSFKQAPRIWPSHVVEGNDFWSGVVLTPSKTSLTADNAIEKVEVESGSQLALSLTLKGVVNGDSVDILTDGLDVLIVRIKAINEMRKWVRLKHTAIKRALIHPSYETANAGILRVRLNGRLPTNYRTSLKVSIQGNIVRVQLPALDQ